MFDQQVDENVLPDYVLAARLNATVMTYGIGDEYTYREAADKHGVSKSMLQRAVTLIYDIADGRLFLSKLGPTIMPEPDTNHKGVAKRARGRIVVCMIHILVIF